MQILSKIKVLKNGFWNWTAYKNAIQASRFWQSCCMSWTLWRVVQNNGTMIFIEMKNRAGCVHIISLNLCWQTAKKYILNMMLTQKVKTWITPPPHTHTNTSISSTFSPPTGRCFDFLSEHWPVETSNCRNVEPYFFFNLGSVVETSNRRNIEPSEHRTAPKF